eukprot:9035785-Pyramimonas_sp.AAC.1
MLLRPLSVGSGPQHLCRVCVARLIVLGCLRSLSQREQPRDRSTCPRPIRGQGPDRYADGRGLLCIGFGCA